MQSIQGHPAPHGRLRFVFRDTVVSLGIVADLTFGEIARTLRELSRQRFGDPVAIDVTFGPRGTRSGRGGLVSARARGLTLIRPNLRAGRG